MHNQVNLADAYETVARTIEPDAPAVLCDGEVLTWGEMEHQSNALARYFVQRLSGPDAKVGIYMRNGPGYIVAFIAALKARCVPFNVNYRYASEEISYLLDNADCEAVLFDADFWPVLGAIPDISKMPILVSFRGSVEGVEPIEDILDGPSEPLALKRSPDDLMFTYTGGTTGMPKAVMWPGGAVWANLVNGMQLPGRDKPDTLDKLTEQIKSGEGRVRFYIAPPLMHGTGLMSAIGIQLMGGSLVMTGRPSYDAEATLEEIGQLDCMGLVIVGDAFAKPLLDRLREDSGRYDLETLRVVSSSGMMFSPDVKLGLLEFLPELILLDGLGASESSAFASSRTTKDTPPGEAQFDLTGAVVVDPRTLSPIEPGSDQIGILAKGGPQPLGYYKDPERTKKTYVTIDGERYVLGGDHATVNADGTIKLLGRGSNCINTAGEKVYPEEVEEALKRYSSVKDALVFGQAHPRFGQSVVAVISTYGEASLDAVEETARKHIAGYKIPQKIVVVEKVPRADNGKADYVTARELFDAKVGVE